MRQQAGLTQEQLAEKAGVGLRFVRDLEQGKETLRLDKVNQVLAIVGYQLQAEKKGVDPYTIWMNYCNKAVIITLKDRNKLFGFIVKEIKDNNNKIVAWEFVPNNKALEFQKTKNPDLTTEIKQDTIQDIELQ